MSATEKLRSGENVFLCMEKESTDPFGLRFSYVRWVQKEPWAQYTTPVLLAVGNTQGRWAVSCY